MTPATPAGGAYLGAVLAGGQSRRLGRDKALEVVGGRTMLEHSLAALTDAGCRPVVVVGGERELPGVTELEDDFPGEGPLGGMLTALRHAAVRGAAGVAVVPCDVPGIDARVVRTLIDASASTSPTSVAVARTERLEPTCSVWPVASLAIVERSFTLGQRAVHRVLADVAASEVGVDGFRLANVNTPADLRAARAAGRPAVGSDDVSIGEITVDELAALGPDIRLIDVREDDEWAEVHAAHAEHVALGTVPDNVDRFDGTPTYVICRSGGRSMQACEFLAAQGLEVVNVTGGTLAWVAGGHPVESGAGGAGA